MTSTFAAIDTKAQCLEFAASYPTPAVREAIRYAEAGAITWEQVAGLFKRSLTAAIVEVA